MAKKRKRTSLAPYVQHLAPSSSPPNDRNHEPHGDNVVHHNLSAYHPDLSPESLSASDLAEYSSLLPLCMVHPSTFPPNTRKYWRHRFSLFSLYSSGCLLDEQSWYSVTPECVAFRIAKRCATDRVIVDLFAGAGGNAIQFAMTCNKVLAVELDPVKLRLARWNAKVYGVEDRIQFVDGDSMELLEKLQKWRKEKRKDGSGDEELWKGITAADSDAVEVVFLSPPWGGVDYAQPTTTITSTADDPAPSTSTSAALVYSLSSILPIDGVELFSRVCSAFDTTNIAYYLPRNTSLDQLSHLEKLITTRHNSEPDTSAVTKANKSRAKVEYQYVNYGSKLSSLTAYYGQLATEWDDQVDDWHKS